jgi:hypothetical protein
MKYSERSSSEATAKQSHKVLELGAVRTAKGLCMIDDMPELSDRLVQWAVLADTDGLHVPAAAGERPGARASARVVEQGSSLSLSQPCREGRGKAPALDSDQTLAAQKPLALVYAGWGSETGVSRHHEIEAFSQTSLPPMLHLAVPHALPPGSAILMNAILI